ncbi:MAG: O-antigen ligase family protein [Cellvibrionaceae bacterium]|nr:O-antigen ligase family protein [Cellvibrionaceae bacterium]
MNYLFVARIVGLCLLVSMTVSTALTSVFEILLWLLVLSSGVLRRRLGLIVKQPMAYSLCLFVVFAGLSYFWSAGDVDSKVESLWGLRKALLLLPFAAIFDDKTWVYRAMLTFIATVVLLALLSWFMKLTGIYFYKGYDAVIHNHATQGIFFTLAGFFALYLLWVEQPVSLGLGLRIALSLAALLLFLNVIFVTTGRSGYLSMILLTILFGAYLSLKKHVFYLPALLIIVTGAIILSPTANQQIDKAITNTLAFNQSASATSMGYRVNFWRNALMLIGQSPVVGHGAGGFEAAYKALVADQQGWQATASADPHNEYLRVAAQQGIIGLLLFCYFLYCSLFQKGEAQFKLLGIMLLLTWCGLSLVNSHFSTFIEGRFIFIWCGMLLFISPPLPQQHIAATEPAQQQ